MTYTIFIVKHFPVVWQYFKFQSLLVFLEAVQGLIGVSEAEYGGDEVDNGLGDCSAQLRRG
jgi:hypothetical protein